jgi:LmbE family N-acetylglucosaminyl deacetylase
MRFICFMNNLIFSPHTDDAIFSLGDYIINDNSFTIASAFAGVPTDTAGYKKHTILRKEHQEACELVGAKIINNDLLDDVYGKQDEQLLVAWIKSTINNFDNIYVPLGIHHPDHIFLSDKLFEIMDLYNKKYFIYAELPYRILYPELYENRINKFKSKNKIEEIKINFSKNKINAVRKYKSQIDDNLIEKLIVQEKLWRLLS